MSHPGMHIYLFSLACASVACTTSYPLSEHILQQAFINYRYTDDGHCIGVAEFVPPTPTRVHWELTEPYLKAIDTSYNVSK